VHFARRKYQPFGGPDGGDGGQGGDVLLVGNRAVDSLGALRYAKLDAADGRPGQGNLKAGANAPSLEISVPPGTLASDVATGRELGAVKSTADRLILARGGKGGKGNPHFATAQNRVPKRSQPGEPGEELDIELRYRIYAETILVEPAQLAERLLLPLLLERDVTEVDYDLYRRKPRWVRTQHQYRLYDCAFLGLDYDVEGRAVVIHGPHAYWGKHVFINLLPVESPEAVWDSLRPWLLRVELRQAERICVCAPDELFRPWHLDGPEGNAQVDCIAVESDHALLDIR
jgi:hypothetical protein